MENTLEKPNHYKLLKIQPVEYTMMNNYESWRGNIIKYASRGVLYKPLQCSSYIYIIIITNNI